MRQASVDSSSGTMDDETAIRLAKLFTTTQHHHWKTTPRQLVLAFLLLIITACCYLQEASAEHKKSIYIAGFFPTSPDIAEGHIGRGVIPAVDLALHHINNSPHVLRGFNLDLVWNDTRVSFISCDMSIPYLRV